MVMAAVNPAEVDVPTSSALDVLQATKFPADWIELELQELAEPEHPICYGIVQVGRHVPNGIPILAIKHLHGFDEIDLHRTSSAVERPYIRSRIKPRDVLVSVKGTTGRIGIVPVGFFGNISRDIARIRVRENFSPEFIFHALNSAFAQKRLTGATVGTTRLELSIATLKLVKMPLPPTRVEQDAIAEALTDADAHIESLQQLFEKKLLIKQGAMQELLSGRRRLPGFGGDWKQTSLGKIANVTTGGRNNQDKVEGGEYPFFVRSKNVENIDTYSYDCEAILVPGEGGIGTIFHYIEGRFDVHQRVYAITQFGQEFSGRFLYYYLAQHFGAHAMQNTVKATVDSLRLPTFHNFEMTVPPSKAEQAAIATLLSDMDAELEVLDARLEKARQIKQGMMQELLTGRVRLV